MKPSPRNAVVVLQARTGSHRLPGKALHILAGRPLVAHCLERLKAARVGTVVLATTTASADDALVQIADTLGIPAVRGSESDVLARFVTVVNQFPAEVVVRATGDNPAVDVDSPARLLTALETSSSDYIVESGLPYGAGVEVFRRSVLMQAHAEAEAPEDREHVTTWIKESPGRYRVTVLPAPTPLRRPALRLTVDTADDLTYMRRLLAAAGAQTRVVPLTDIIRTADRLSQLPEVA
jgi:spore coat polysaccharide biosynthesis protein SpsF (cytidylyltransferase family)